MATTYLEGNLYPTSSSIIPSLLSLQEHLLDEEKKFTSLGNLPSQLLLELNRRFKSVIDVKSEDFDQTFLMTTILNPEKSAELNAELYEEGKRRLESFLISENKALGVSFRGSQTKPSSNRTSAGNANNESQPDKPGKTVLFKRRRLNDNNETPTQAELDENDRLQRQHQQLLKNEIQNYFLLIDKGEFDYDVDSVFFWISHSGQFPNLAPLALRYQALPATSASVERLFSIAGLGCKGNRNAIKPCLLEAETLCKFNRKLLPPSQLALYR